MSQNDNLGESNNMITPSTIITAELLAGLDKCPFCGDQPKPEWKTGIHWYMCGTMINPGFQQATWRSDQTLKCAEAERETLRARVKELEEELEFNGRVLHSMQTERDNALALLGVYKIKNDELKGIK